MEDNIPEMTLLIESMNGAFTTESAVTNLGTDYEMSDEENSKHDEQIKFVFEDQFKQWINQYLAHAGYTPNHNGLTEFEGLIKICVVKQNLDEYC